MRMPVSSGRRRALLDPLDGTDRIGLAQRGDDRVKVREVMHLDVEMERLEAAVAVDQLKVDDVGVLLAENPRHRAEGSRDVAQDDGKTCCPTIRTFSPRQVEPVGVDTACERVAADDMDFDLFVFAAKADDAIPWDRVAALSQMIRNTRSQALDRNRLALRERLRRSDVGAR